VQRVLPRHLIGANLELSCILYPVLPCCACRYGGAAAVWDIWRRQDAQPLQGWLVEHQAEFVHQGKVVSGVTQPLLDQVRSW
jgi:hypothetical protein